MSDLGEAITAVRAELMIGNTSATETLDRIARIVFADGLTVVGVTLTPEEREKLAYAVRHARYSSTIDVFVAEWFEEHGEALAARLEAAS